MQTIAVADEGHHRRAGIERLHQAGGEVGGTGAQRRIDQPDAPRHLGVGIRREGTAALVVDEVVIERQPPRRVVDGQQLEPTHAEHWTGVEGLEHAGHRLAARNLVRLCHVICSPPGWRKLATRARRMGPVCAINLKYVPPALSTCIPRTSCHAKALPRTRRGSDKTRGADWTAVCPLVLTPKAAKGGYLTAAGLPAAGLRCARAGQLLRACRSAAAAGAASGEDRAPAPGSGWA